MKARKLLSILIAIIMVLGVMPYMALTAFAEDEVGTTASQADESVTVTSGDYSLTVNKTQFEVGEPILVSATAQASNDWIGIYKANQMGCIYWDYVSTYGNGVSFDIREATQQGGDYSEELGAIPEGRYIVRFVPNGGMDYTSTACQIVITVGNPGVVEGDSTLMSVEKNNYAPGEKIMVSGKGSGKDWIGIYRSNAQSTTYSNMWKYIADVGEDVEFDVTAGQGLPEGDYLLCLIKNDASKPMNASAWAVISVAEESSGGSDNTGGGEATDPDEGGTETPDDGDTTTPEGMQTYTSEQGQSLTLKTEYDVNDPVYVIATGVNTKDWVGITERGSTDAAIRWQYIDKSAGGAGQGEGFDLRVAQYVGGTYTSSALASLPAGEYTIHLVQNNGYIKDGASVITVDITITGESTGGETGGDDTTGDDDTTGEESELLTLEKTTFTVGEPIMVTAISSDDTDWVGIFNTSGNYLKWHYVTSSLSGVAYDVTQGIAIPAGTYTIRLIPKDGSKNTTPLASVTITITEDENLSAPTSATYDIEDATSGYAKGTVTVTVDDNNLTNRSIVMYWANENGKLEGYTMHARFKVTGEQTSFTFSDSVIIPKGATCLHVHTQNTTSGFVSEDYVVIDLPQGSDMDSLGTPDTSFFVVSDIHIGRGNGNVSATNWKKMLNEAIALNPNGVAIYIVGDMADGGTEAQFAEMMSLYNEVLEANGKEASSYPLFMAIGNHDYPVMTSVFLEYATLPDGTHPTDTSYDFWLNGYHYIFLGSDTNSGLYANLTAQTLTWLDEKLSENRDESRPTFVFLHQSLKNTVSGSFDGEGWNGVTNDDELRAVLAKYPEVLMFNGHSHWTMDSVGNIFEGTEELPIHIFNCASVSYLWSGYNIVTGESLDGSQGYYVEIYDNKIVVRGRDFVASEWISAAQYCVELADDGCTEHSYVESEISYENGFGSTGTITYTCQVCSAQKTESCEPIFTSKGFSVPAEGGEAYSYCVGYILNYDASEAYERVNGVEVNLGLVLINPTSLTGDTFFEKGAPNVSNENGALMVSIQDNYSSINVLVSNIDSAYLDVDFIISAYVTVVSGNEEAPDYQTQFIQVDGTGKKANTYVKNDGTLYSVSYNSLTKNS